MSLGTGTVVSVGCGVSLGIGTVAPAVAVATADGTAVGSTPGSDVGDTDGVVAAVGETVTGGNGAPGNDGETYGHDGGWAGKAYGGAVYIDPNSEPTFTDCSFTNCTATGGNGGDGGNGADFWWAGRGGNWEWSASMEAGFLGWDGWQYGPYEDYWRYSGHGGAVFSESYGSPRFVNCTFDNNRTFGGVSGVSGTAYYVWMGPTRPLDIPNFGGSNFGIPGSGGSSYGTPRSGGSSYGMSNYNTGRATSYRSYRSRRSFGRRW